MSWGKGEWKKNTLMGTKFQDKKNSGDEGW